MNDLLNMSGKEIIAYIFCFPLVIGLATAYISSVFLFSQWLMVDERLVTEAQWCLAAGVVLIIVGRLGTGPISTYKKGYPDYRVNNALNKHSERV